MELDGKTAIVTGASRGIGASFSAALIKEGCTVYGLARSLNSLNDHQEQLGGAFIPVRMDVTNEDAIRSWVDQTFSDDHLPEILINNAGSGHFGKIDEMPSEEWRSMVDANINGVYNLTSSIVPLMKRNKRSSHIVNTGSILGTLGNSEMSGYCATKFAVRGFSEALFKELRYDDIKVTCLNPGSIETNFFADEGVQPHENMLQPSAIAETLIHILETLDNMLINELTMRPLNPKSPKE